MATPGLLLLSMLGACSGFDATKGSADGDSADTAANGNGGGSPDDSGQQVDTGGLGGPAWWTLEATVHIAEGLPQVEGSSLTVALLDDGLAELCRQQVALASIVVEEKPPSPSIHAWWQAEPGAKIGDGCGAEGTLLLAARFGLGVGELHPDIRARLVVAGYPDAALSGAYAAPTGAEEPLYVYGAAGLPPAWEGEGSPSSAGVPLADGAWLLLPLSTFEYPK